MSSTKRKKALGRGLDAILQSPDTDITTSDISGGYVAGAIADIPITNIETNPFQPRTDFDEMEMREMADSIKTQGVIQPITVRKLGYDKYQLISGERRLRASRMAGLEKIPAFIRVANDEQMLEMALIENTHRKNLNPIEIAISYKRLIDECKLTQEQLSEKVGKNRSTVTNFLRLLKLPAEVQAALRDGFISMGHARALLGIDDLDIQLTILKAIIARGLSVRHVERIVQGYNDQKGKGRVSTPEEIPEEYKQIAAQLSRRLGATVRLKRNKGGNGKIVISFKGDSELKKIVTRMGD